MPWEIRRNYGGCSGFAVVKKPDGELEGCHNTVAAAESQMRALYASEGEMGSMDKEVVTNEQTSNKNPQNMSASSVYKQENINWQEGMFVMGPEMSDGKHSHGKIEHIMTDGSLGTGSKFEIQATMENPALLIRLYEETDNGWEETELLVGIKSSEAMMIGTEQDMQDHSMEKATSLADLDLKPTESMANNARRGLELRSKFGRGGTSVGVARARDLANRKNLSPDTVARMYSFFSRHEVDKKGKDFNNPERPSNGKIAWLLWGGDSGFSWSRSKWAAIQRIRARKSENAVWNESALSLEKFIKLPE
jgi:hypothetical protein